MNIYISTPDTPSTLELEQHVIQRIPECEVSTVIHHEAYIYRHRTGPIMVSRAIIILMASCDIAIITEENEFLEKVCKLIGIPVYRSLDEFLDTPVEALHSSDVEKEFKEFSSSWCSGCNHSGMSPMENPGENCKHYVKECGLFDFIEEALEC